MVLHTLLVMIYSKLVLDKKSYIKRSINIFDKYRKGGYKNKIKQAKCEVLTKF